MYVFPMLYMNLNANEGIFFSSVLPCKVPFNKKTEQDFFV